MIISVVAAFNQEKALVGAFSVITNLRMELFQALSGMRMWLKGNFERLKLVRLLKHVNQQPHLHGIRPALVVEARRTLAVLQNLLKGSLEQAVGHLVAVAGDRINRQ